MPRSKLPNPIPVPLKELADNWLHVDGSTRDRIAHGKAKDLTNFVVSWTLYDEVGYEVNGFGVTYYGEVKGGNFMVKSYSYTTKGLRGDLKSSLDYDPWQVAMEGLGFVGVRD